MKHGSKLAKLEFIMRKQPRYRLTLDLYRYPEALRELIFLRFSDMFAFTSFPLEITEATYAVITNYMKEQYGAAESSALEKKAEASSSSRPKKPYVCRADLKGTRKRARWLDSRDWM